MIVVSDTSSISNLLQIGLIYVLHELFGEVKITPAVQRELYKLEGQQELIEKISWIEVQAPINQRKVNELLEELDLGESESIVLAIESNADYLIIDEYHGRTIAEKLGIRIVGVLGILILAKRKGLILGLKEEIDKLYSIGFRLNKKLVDSVLAMMEEE